MKLNKTCRDGGTGRRAGLKHQWKQFHEGSIPSLGTKLTVIENSTILITRGRAVWQLARPITSRSSVRIRSPQPIKMSYVYILFSSKDNKTYTGSTPDLERRLEEHNNGQVQSTKNRRLLKLIYKEYFENLIDARTKEKYYKTCAGRKKLKELLQGDLLN